MTPAYPAPWRSLSPELPDDWSARPATLVDAFANAVARPDAPFLHYFGRSIGYREVDDRMRSLAAYFAHAGVGTGDRVVLALQNVPDFLIATLAAWHVGAIVMPVNPMYRERELAHLFDDAQPTVVICHPDHLSVVRATAGEAVPAAGLLLSDPRADRAEVDDRVLPPVGDADDDVSTLAEIYSCWSAEPSTLVKPSPASTAMLLYTSGTTGRPKGAALSHANLAHSVHAAVAWFSLRDQSCVLAMAPLFHITGFTLHFAVALVTRGSLVLGYRFHPEAMLEAMARYRPTFSIAPITAYFALQAVEGVSADHFASFETLATGGAPAPAAAVYGFRERFGCDLLNGYGMTELAGGSHFPPPGHPAPVDPESGALSIGMPVFGAEARIVDDAGKDVEIGEIGELLIRSPQVMQEYWHNDEASQHALTDGWLRTGDVAKMREDGWFFLVDRKRDMIVASGFKVWPREVEDVLYAHPAVQEAAVVGVFDAYRGETVKAFLVLKKGAVVDADDLIAHCRSALAAYKVPRSCEFLEELPKTLTGKIVRAQLRPSVQ